MKTIVLSVTTENETVIADLLHALRNESFEMRVVPGGAQVSMEMGAAVGTAEPVLAPTSRPRRRATPKNGVGTQGLGDRVKERYSALEREWRRLGLITEGVYDADNRFLRYRVDVKASLKKFQMTPHQLHEATPPRGTALFILRHSMVRQAMHKSRGRGIGQFARPLHNGEETSVLARS